MRKKKIKHSKFKSNVLLRTLQSIAIILIIISGFIYFKYWPTISSLYDNATIKVNIYPDARIKAPFHNKLVKEIIKW